MTERQFDAMLTMLCGMRVALLGIVDALETFLVANGRLKERTADIRRRLKSEQNGCILSVEN